MAGRLALWDLRAEQVMDRVFAGVETPPPALPAAIDPAPPPARGPGRRRLLLAGAGLGLLLGSLIHLWQTQQRVQLDLQQERQWRMLERLRALDAPANRAVPAPPAPPELPAQPPAQVLEAPITAPARRLARVRRPRDPEQTRRIGPPPIRVPVPKPAPPRLPPPRQTAPQVQVRLPELLGVVQTAGQRDSAIFSTAAGPLSVTPGESIGSTGWRLLGVTAEGVEIVQGNERRSLSLGR